MSYWEIIVAVAAGIFGVSLGIVLGWHTTTALEKTFAFEFSLAMKRVILIVGAVLVAYVGLLWALSIY